ncbi:TonB-linked outer membrane protein, SusC/RagA family [Pedobacter terrae]|uniref:TonB-linked outer membrane protein, SusC/RagA family n=1 Tax=Pedobacter terrae TaxID=405671 RepID=A0A1G7W3D3_9SPHI|nr:TonB-dependent receptor [Pedobacter terrae]SDG66391.1 TonB-linked outer membrane protein, SusC/RagA family [Pedobacter terrae]
MKFIKSKYIICLLFIMAGMSDVYGQKPDEKLTIAGRVVDQDKKPLPGVTVTIQEDKSNKAVSTGTDGTFSIDATSSDVLIFKFVGFGTMLKPAAEVSRGDIILTKSLVDGGDDDNVYIPFGVRKRREVTSTISTIRAEDLPQIPSSSLTNVFTGRLAGLAVYPSGSQQPGYDASSFLVRGRSSYNSNQEPLVLVDGIERDFTSMDLNEIESVSVLKDAGTLAWYGMYGGNGVIYVKTRRGSATSTKVSFDAQAGLQAPLQITAPLDAYSYATLYNEASVNSGGAAVYAPAALQAYQDGSDPIKYPNNNFVRDFTKKVAPTQRYVASVTGGNAFIKYYTVLSAYQQGGFYKGGHSETYDANTDFSRYNLRTNLDLHVNKNLDVALDIGGRITTLNFPNAGTGAFLTAVYSTPANAFPILNPNGSYGGTSVYQQSNPLAMLQSRGASTDLMRNMIATISARQKMDGILKGLSGEVFYAYDIAGLYRSGFAETYATAVLNADGTYSPFGTASKVNYQGNAFSGNVKKSEFWAGLDYNRTFGKHDIKFSTRVSRANLSSFGNLDVRREGWSNRLSYNFIQRYFVDVTANYSGSENFAPGKRYGFFPAASAGWIISDENFMKGSGSFLDLLKIRGSYGLVGNDAIGSARRFAFNDFFSRSTTGYNFGTAFSGVSGTGQLALANPDLTWEKVYKTSIGFDARLFKQALSISADYFYEDRKDLATSSLLPSLLGQSLIYVNEGEAEYKGFEAGINYNKKIGAVNLNVFGNFTYNVSKILAINEGAGLPAYQKQLGHPISSVISPAATATTSAGYISTMLISNGIFQSQAEIDASAKQMLSGSVKPGDIKYVDQNGDGLINDLDRVRTDFNFVPKAFFGFGASIAVKNFDLNFLFQGTSGRSITIQNLVNSGNANNGYLSQFSVNRWTPGNPNAPYPRLLLSDRGNNTANSDFWIRSGDYIRLKNIELGYSLAPALIKRLKISQLRFYVGGLNLLTFDQLGDLPIDPELPESGYNASYPYMKIYSLGLNLKF